MIEWVEVDQYHIADKRGRFTVSFSKNGRTGKTDYSAWDRSKVHPRKGSHHKLRTKIGERYYDNGSLGIFRSMDEAKQACEDYRA